MEHYLHQAAQFRKHTPEPDVTLERLRHGVFAFMGVRERMQPDEATYKLNLPKFTKEETDAWTAAGMPSPMLGWIEGYRNAKSG